MSIKTAFTNCQGWYNRSAHYFYSTFLAPRSNGEDSNRSERILTYILAITILITGFFEVVIAIVIATNNNYKGVPLSIFSCILAIYFFLLYLTRRGKYLVAGYAYIFLLFFCIVCTSYRWGASLPMGLLGYGLVVTIAGIVISSRFGFIMALLSSVSVITIGLHEHFAHILPSWKLSVLDTKDVIGYAIMIGITALLSRLSNKEMEQSLKRARDSEAALKQERDNLEITVRERTKALRESERERMRELYRFAEFGKLSGGIFHDLVGPLTAVTLSVEKLSTDSQFPTENLETLATLKTARDATKRMEAFISTVKKQIKTEDLRGLFSLNTEIEDAIAILKHKALKVNAQIIFTADFDITLLGNPLKFNQVVLNLITNAIDAGATQIAVALFEKTTENGEVLCICTVTDNGSGIEPSILPNIFLPFFTTKTSGLGIGLSTSRDIVTTYFSGTLSCESNVGRGSTFTVAILKNKSIPKNQHAKQEILSPQNTTYST